MVHIVGRMNVREWEAQDGGKRKAWELVAANVVFGPRKGGGAPGSEGYGMGEGDQEIPF
jgi:single-stranded DNA-binding protein